MPRGRKPVDESAVGGLLLRQRVYEVVRDRGEQWWTLTEIAARAKAHPTAVQSYVHALGLAGIVVSRTESRRRQAADRHETFMAIAIGDEEQYRLAVDAGAEAPQVTKGGAIVDGLTAQEAIWKAARVFRRFTWEDIAGAVSSDERPVSSGTVKAYLADLHAAGYLKKSIPSRPGVPALWSLRPERDTGPRAPMVQRSKTIFDPNTGQSVFRWTDAEPVEADQEAKSA